MLNNIAGVLAPQVPAVTSSYESITSATPSGTGTVTFSSIPSTFKHLQVRLMAASASGTSYLQMRVNSDTTAANYAAHYLVGFGSGTPSAGGGASRAGDYGIYPTSTTTFAAGVIDVLDYQNTSKYKTIRCLNGYDANGSGQISLNSQLWMNSGTAINALTFTFDNAANFSTGTVFALYGIKG